MRNSLFVISDLHLGGRPASGDEPSFQICSDDGQKRLVEFIDYVMEQQTDGHDVHLLVNGDLIDFLAEETFSSFTNGNQAALNKLRQAIDHSRSVWEAFKRFTASGARLTLLVGNHDIEASLPAARQELMATVGPGRVDFRYDNEAYTQGPVLIEHGNRYDGWNAVSHGTLRAIRSALSRGEDPPEYLGPAGSQLVQSVMNPIKKDYPFVDLLKPEGPGMIPVLAVLHPAALTNIGKFSALAARSLEVRFDRNGIPVDQQNIAGAVGIIRGEDTQLRLARKLAGIPDEANISALAGVKGLLDRIKSAVGEAAREREIDLLLEALRNFAEKQYQAFNVNHEDDAYLEPVQDAMRRGFRLVIYGHTHLVKRVACDDGKALYLNTGTWADLMRLPEGILKDDEGAARAQLKHFLSDLESRKLGGWRKQLPTFARVEFDGDTYLGGDVYLFEQGKARRVPDGQLTGLDRAEWNFGCSTFKT